MLFSSLLFLMVPSSSASFTTISKTELDFGGRFVLGISSFVPGEGEHWFVSAFDRMDGGSVTLYRFDESGNIEKEYGERGQGPGELRGSIELMRYDNRIYAAESTHRVIHVYNTELEHIRDIKTTMVGRIKIVTEDYVGIWYPVPAGPNISNMVTAVPLKENLERKTFVSIQRDKIPILIHTWGDIINLPDGRFASVLGNQYIVRVYNSDFSLEKTLVNHSPGHITPYYAFKGDTKVIGPEAFDWMWSFTKFNKILYNGTNFIVIHQKGKDEGNYADFIDESGKIIERNISIGNRIPSTWWIDEIVRLDSEEDQDVTTFYILTERVKVD